MAKNDDLDSVFEKDLKALSPEQFQRVDAAFSRVKHERGAGNAEMKRKVSQMTDHEFEQLKQSIGA